MATGEFRDANMMALVTEVTVDTDGQWIRATAPGNLDELMNDAAFFAYITSSTGAVLETAVDGLRLAAAALGEGLGGGGASTVALDMGTIGAITTPIGTDELWIWRSGTNGRMTYTEFVSSLSTGTDISTVATATDVTISSSTGTGDTIDLVTPGGNAGLMSGADKTKLDGIQAGLQGTDLGTSSLGPSTLSVTSSTGLDTPLPLANPAGDTAGILGASDARKLQDTVYVTDFANVYPDGSQDSSSGIQAAIDSAVSRDIRRVFFPKGVYLISSTVNLPKDTSGLNKRFTLDFGNSEIRAGADVVLFGRLIASLGEVASEDWMYTFENGTFTAVTPGQGTAFELHKTMSVAFYNFRVKSMKTFSKLLFALEHQLINVNASACLNPFVTTSGEGVFATGGGTQSNVGTWINVRAQDEGSLMDVGFDFAHSSNVTMINCVAEGASCNIAYRFSGQVGTNNRSNLDVTMINCWIEFTTAISTAVVQLDNLVKSNVEIHLRGGSQPAGTLFLQCNGSETKQNTIRWKSSELLNANRFQVTPWFDADIKAATDGKDYWMFEQSLMGGTDQTVDDPARWTSNAQGDVPPHYVEESWQYATGDVYNSRLTIPANTLLANASQTDAELVKGVDIASLPTTTAVPNTNALVSDASGNFARLDVTSITATSRKDGVDDIGNQVGTVNVDLDSTTFDNVDLTITGTTDLSWQSTRAGAYDIYVRMDATGGHAVTIGMSTLSPPAAGITFNTSSNGVTVLRLRYDGTTWHWG